MDIQALEKVKQQWQSAADLMPQLICLVNHAGMLLHMNRTVERWGLGEVAHARGRALHDVLHPQCNDPACYFPRLWEEVTPARERGRRTERQAYDARLGRHLVIRIQPLIRGHQKRTAPDDLHAVVVVDDVSDLKQAEALIQARNAELAEQVEREAERRALSEETQARLLTILEKTTDYVGISDLSQSTLYLNPAGRALLGLQHGDDIAGRSLCEHADPEVRRHIREVAIPSAIRNGLWEGESSIRDQRGRQIHASQVIIAHRRADGEVDCLSTILRDISHRVNAEQALRESREALRRVSAQLVSIQEDERRRIALDLHDGLGQTLNLIKLCTENAVALLAAGRSEEGLAVMQQLVPRLKDALHDVRRVSSELRPAILDDLGILPTLSWFFREFEASCRPLVIEKTLAIREADVPAPLKITLYRILQEATSNTLKHAGAGRLRVSVYRDDERLHLRIEDDGCGFDPAHTVVQDDGRTGLGLVSMKERVALSGGCYRLVTAIGKGTTIEASWPLPAPSDTAIEPFHPIPSVFDPGIVAPLQAVHPRTETMTPDIRIDTSGQPLSSHWFGPGIPDFPTA